MRPTERATPPTRQDVQLDDPAAGGEQGQVRGMEQAPATMVSRRGPNRTAVVKVGSADQQRTRRATAAENSGMSPLSRCTNTPWKVTSRATSACQLASGPADTRRCRRRHATRLRPSRLIARTHQPAVENSRCCFRDAKDEENLQEAICRVGRVHGCRSSASSSRPTADAFISQPVRICCPW